MNKGRLLFLGCGSSTGVPMIGCSCPVCTSADPRNHRLRPSVLVGVNGLLLLVDPGPDLRQQALKYHLKRLDGVVLTHTHYDHIAGIDELRAFYLQKKEPLPLLLSQVTHEELQRRYPYLFVKHTQAISLPAQLSFQILPHKRGRASFLNIPIAYFSYEQGGMEVTGFRFGSLAYVSDLSKYPLSLFDDLKGVETLIVSALKKEPSLMHLSIEEACHFAARVGAPETYLMHLSHEVEYGEISKELPKGVHLAYDGLELQCEV